MQAIRPRASAHQACEAALRRAVLTGELTPGARLPPERALAETLGVSRLTLRAALAALTAQGVLAVRHGSGYVVQDVSRTGGGELLADLAAMAGERGELASLAAELLRVRRHLAHAVLEHLVAHPPKASAIRRFEAAIDAMQHAIAETGDSEVLAAADLEVVAALLDATASPVLRLCLNPVSAVVASSPALRHAMYADPASNVAGWRGLAAWLRKPSHPEAALALLAARDAATLARLGGRGGSRRQRG
jgi:GntR family transcriptional regulator, transcriptional repressor for pyruvate dehydrogenase complex